MPTIELSNELMALAIDGLMNGDGKGGRQIQSSGTQQPKGGYGQLRRVGNNQQQQCRDEILSMARSIRHPRDALLVMANAKKAFVTRDCPLVTTVLQKLWKIGPPFKSKRVVALKVLMELDEEPDCVVIANLSRFVESREDVNWLFQFISTSAKAPFGFTPKMLTEMQGVVFDPVSAASAKQKVFCVNGGRPLEMSSAIAGNLINACIGRFENKKEGKQMAWLIFNHLYETGSFVPDAAKLTILCKTVSDVQDLAKMRGLFGKYRIPMDVISYGTLINACIDKFHDKQAGKQLAWSLFYEMVGNGIVPDVEKLNMLSKTVASVDELYKMRNLFDQYALRVDAIGYGTLINACLQKLPNRLNEGKELAWKLFYEMIGNGIPPDVEKLTMLCKGVSNTNELERMRGLFRLHRDIKMNILTYNTIMNACLENFEDKGSAYFHILSLSHEMEAVNMVPDRFTKAILDKAAKQIN